MHLLRVLQRFFLKKREAILFFGGVFLFSAALIIWLLSSGGPAKSSPLPLENAGQISPQETSPGSNENEKVDSPNEDNPSPPQRIKIGGPILRGDTIISLFQRQDIDYSTAHKLFTDVKPVYNLRRVRAGNEYHVIMENGEVVEFIYEIDAEHYLQVQREGDGFRGEVAMVPYRIKTEVVEAEITVSLFESILNIGERAELADKLASLYEYDIDFNRDIREGDGFRVLVEKKFLNGEFSQYGDILAAEFVNRGKAIQVVRYTDPDGRTAYYHPDGRSVRKMFLRCPLPFMRVTSSYGMRRHPVRGFSARHYGVDLGAPRGTIVRATASGIVKKTGIGPIKGKYVILRHNNGYVGHYYHLSGFAKGVKTGNRVEQGQIIGYVGSSGRTTGPHLHYGIAMGSRFINPLRLKSPAKKPVNKAFLENFKNHTASLFLLMSAHPLESLIEKLQNTLITAPQTPLSQIGTPVN